MVVLAVRVVLQGRLCPANKVKWPDRVIPFTGVFNGLEVPAVVFASRSLKFASRSAGESFELPVRTPKSAPYTKDYSVKK